MENQKNHFEPGAKSTDPSQESQIKNIEIEQAKYLSLLSILKGHEEYLLDEHGIIISSNLEAVNITGYEEYEVIGKHISILYQEDEQLKAFADLRKASKLGKIAVAGLRLKKRKTPFWAKMTFESSAEPEKKIRYKVTLKDGTHRALANLRVRTIRDEYLSIFNNPFVGTFKFRMADGQVMMWNPKAAQITGIEEFGQVNFMQIFQHEHEYHSLMRLLKEGGKVEDFEFQLSENGFSFPRWCILSCRYFPMQDFVEGILLDITEKKSQMIELEKVNTELDQFIYHASHDLRSPLTTMLGLTQLIRIDQSKGSIELYNRLLQERIHHMDKLLRDLVFVVNNNKTPVERTPVWFSDEINVLLGEFEFNSHVKIEVDVTQDSEFFTDKMRLNTILRNLTCNALKYYNRNEKSPRLIIALTIVDDKAIFTFTDNGIGIADEFQSRVFDMFFRASTNSDGSGLGLFIARSMVEKMGGDISVCSEIGIGSTFQFVLPNLAVVQS